MKRDSKVEVRYVPAICGSPGWMSRADAERELAREMDVIESLAACGAEPANLPYIHEPKQDRSRRRPTQGA